MKWTSLLQREQGFGKEKQGSVSKFMLKKSKLSGSMQQMTFVYVNVVYYGNLSVIPFLFPLKSDSFLLLLHKIKWNLFLYKRMANVIKLRKGLDINLKGKAAEQVVACLLYTSDAADE